MPTRSFDFLNAAGETLSGRLELPVGPARAWAIFAHCFTCGKDNLAAVRVSRRLAGAGIGVLRFDFTGLGHSGGAFVDSSFSLNVEDIVAAAAAMAAADMPSLLLIGHSLGGAAVMAAAIALPQIRAVAVIAAPLDAAHVLDHFDTDAIAEIDRAGSATAKLGGRDFLVGHKLINDLRAQRDGHRIAELKRPLLVLHSPTDQVVGINNATSIYLAARHPKSFVSLDGADHLLSKAADADFAADVIAVWAGRYLPAAATARMSEEDAEAEETGLGKFQLAMRAGKANFLADEPESLGGLGSGPSPYDLLSAALAACTTMTLRSYATMKGWPLGTIRTAVAHRKEPGQQPADVFSRTITIQGLLDDDRRAKLLAIADRCPVHRTLEAGSRFDAAALPVLDRQNLPLRK